jgi:hypothetical protein
MIYSDDFVWLHFPKCAGVKIEQLFEKYFSNENQIVQDIIDPALFKKISWHDSVADREARDPSFSLGERIVICSFRKLPSWLISRYSFEYHRSPNLNHRPELLIEGRFLEQGGSLNHADNYVRKYLPEKILNSDKLRFIRTEYFEHDFKLVFGEFLDISVIPDWEYQKKVNVSRLVVPEVIRNELIESEEVYTHCPYWKLVEGFFYE